MVLHFVSVLQRKYAVFKTSDTEMRVALAKRHLGRVLWRVLWFVSLPLTVPLAVFLRILLRLLKPFVHIRFGRLWSPRLGTFSLSTELDLCEKDAGLQPRDSVDIFYHYDQDGYVLREPVKPKEAICNQQLNIMWKRTIHVHDFARVLDNLNRMLPHGKAFIAGGVRADGDYTDLLDLFPAHLSFTQAEEQRGLLELDNLGIEPGAPFVCFHARDPAYLDHVRPRNAKLYGDWSWQNSRDTSIGNYLSAAVKLADLGYYAIRMGKYVREPLHCDNPRVIDYASRFQSDFMDVFLSAKCDFFIGQGTGMTALPITFRRPMGFVNIFPLYEISSCAYCSYHKAIFIPKILYSAAKGRPLTFQEILELGIGNFNVRRDPRHKEISDRLGLEIRENTPEEIAEVALEMHQRLRSMFNSSEEDEELQERFISIIRAYPHMVPVGKDRLVRVGTKFLRAHRDLLG